MMLNNKCATVHITYYNGSMSMNVSKDSKLSTVAELENSISGCTRHKNHRFRAAHMVKKMLNCKENRFSRCPVHPHRYM
jgi:hypothetical protein